MRAALPRSEPAGSLRTMLGKRPGLSLLEPQERQSRTCPGQGAGEDKMHRIFFLAPHEDVSPGERGSGCADLALSERSLSLGVFNPSGHL